MTITLYTNKIIEQPVLWEVLVIMETKHVETKNIVLEKFLVHDEKLDETTARMKSEYGEVIFKQVLVRE